jgi:hypothetical protein
MNSDERKQHTPFVPGGQYRMETGVETQIGTLVGVTSKANGRRTGRLVTQQFHDMEVVEGTDDFNAWTLISVPIAPELLEKVRLSLDAIDSLAAQVLELQRKR